MGPLITKPCDPVIANYLGGALDPRGIFKANAIHPLQTIWDWATTRWTAPSAIARNVRRNVTSTQR